MSDVVIAIPILLLLIAPFLYFRLYKTTGLVLVIIAYEGLMAGVWRETISQEWWRLSLLHSWGWLGGMLGLLAIAWGGLLLHLAWKKLWRKP